jgi:hypothetical protein
MFDAHCQPASEFRFRLVRNCIFGEFFTDFRDVLNANNSETAEASQLNPRLLRGLPCCYEPAKSELSRFNSKTVNFATFDPHTKPWGGGGPTGPRSVDGPRRGVIAAKYGDENSNGWFLAGRRATRPRREVKTRRKEGAEWAYIRSLYFVNARLLTAGASFR